MIRGVGVSPLLARNSLMDCEVGADGGEVDASNGRAVHEDMLMADGRWQMADGRWQMADGRWQMAEIRSRQAAVHETARYAAIATERGGRKAESARRVDGYQRSTLDPRRHGFCWQSAVAKSRDVRVRSFDFACDVVALHRSMQLGDWTTRRLSNQLLAAGTSIGANLAEAASGQTRADFIAKNCIALKEARETLYGFAYSRKQRRHWVNTSRL